MISEAVKTALDAWLCEFDDLTPPKECILRKLDNDQKPYLILEFEKAQGGGCSPRLRVKNNLGYVFDAAKDRQRERLFDRELAAQLRVVAQTTYDAFLQIEHYDVCKHTLKRCLAFVRKRRAEQCGRFAPGCIRIRRLGGHSRPPSTSEFWEECEKQAANEVIAVKRFNPEHDDRACHILTMREDAPSRKVQEEAERILKAPVPPMVLVADVDEEELSVELVREKFRGCRKLIDFLNAVSAISRIHGGGCFLISDEPRTFGDVLG